MRTPIGKLEQSHFDVVVVGGGVNGASAAQNLAAEGYRTLLVEKTDYAAGASGLSSRLLHCGLRYLAPGGSMFDFVRDPGKLKVALRMAKQAMQSRTQMVRATPERVRPLRFCFPIWKGGQYAGWQVDLAFKILSGSDRKGEPLDYQRLDRQTVKQTPLIQHLRDFDKLESVATFKEYQFEWPDRICVDTVIDAQRLGAEARNYTSASGFELRPDGRWDVQIRDELTGETAHVTTAIVLNTAGIWIDEVAGRVKKKDAKRRILGTKGTHFMVQLPPECKDFGIATLNRADEPFYCVPWRGMHYFGPTETVYEGDPNDIRPLEQEVEWLLDEANHLLPGLNLKREDVLFTWSGVRPLTYDPNVPKGKRSREIHDYAADGMPNFLAMTAGPIMTHRSAGQELCEAVKARIQPSRAGEAPSFGSTATPRVANEAPVLADWDKIGATDVIHTASNEQVVTLRDLMFHRTGLAWTRTMGFEAAKRIALLVAPTLGWDESRIEHEVRDYRDYLRAFHLVRTDTQSSMPTDMQPNEQTVMQSAAQQG